MSVKKIKKGINAINIERLDVAFACVDKRNFAFYLSTPR